MTLEQLLIAYIIKNGTDTEGTEVIYELPCGCMVAREDAGDELIPCDDHDADSIANDGKELSDMAELIVAAVGQPLVETATTDADVVFPDAPPLEEELDTSDLVKQFVESEEEFEAMIEESAETTTIPALEDEIVFDEFVDDAQTNNNEKDEETMTIELTATRKKMAFAIHTSQGMETVEGYAVESNIELPLAIHKVSNKVWHVSELKAGSVIEVGSTIKSAVEFAQGKLNRIGLDKYLTVINAHLADQKPVVDETPAMESLEDLVADDAPMVDDAPVVDEPVETTVEPMTATEEINALAAELVALTTKGASIATLMKAVRENAGRIVELTTDGDVTPPTPPATKVTPEPKKEEEVTEQPKPQAPVKPEQPKGASEASAFNKFKSAKILEAGTHSVKFEADDTQFIFLKNEAGKTIIRKLGSNSNSYMTGNKLQSLIYDINTATSRALFRKIKDIINIKAPTTQVDGAASNASAKENNSAATNNPADTMTIKGTVISKAWFNTYVADDTMTKKHGHSKMSADTIIAEFQAKK